MLATQVPQHGWRVHYQQRQRRTLHTSSSAHRWLPVHTASPRPHAGAHVSSVSALMLATAPRQHCAHRLIANGWLRCGRAATMGAPSAAAASGLHVREVACGLSAACTGKQQPLSPRRGAGGGRSGRWGDSMAAAEPPLRCAAPAVLQADQGIAVIACVPSCCLWEARAPPGNAPASSSPVVGARLQQ